MLTNDAELARLDRLFDQLIDASHAERAAVLSALHIESPGMHAQLVQMLDIAERLDPALDPDKVDRRAAWQTLAAGPEPGPLLGERIGAWRLVRHLGRGGMGEVYEVARADGAYEQRAALKLILDAIDSHDFLERFARERQILAVLSHSAIAKLLDGGEDSRGRPFLVMEFVDGSSIDQYCATQRLDLDSRLRLFLQVAGAVEHAHRQHVIHRDIKPSNIIVSAAGEAKLLDFGIAKVLSEDKAEHGATRTALLLTPQYSTPEQVLGHSVDYRTDIYQLGLLLFELLTSQRAQEPVDGTPHALLQAVCVDDRVSASACALRVPAAVAARIGNLAPAALARRLRGDLDWIVLKALRQDPQRRYASVQALSDDVQRYLQGAPVQARPETIAYRAGKFVRLHPWGVASTAAAFLLMTAYAFTATYLSRAYANQARLAEQVKSLVLRMFETVNPEQAPQSAQGRELSAKQLLDLSWPLIESETRNQPQVQVELLNTLGETYRQLGDYEQALARLTRARELIKTHPELPREIQATTLYAFGMLLSDQGTYAEAEQMLQQARQLFTQRYGARHVRSAEVLKGLGRLEHNRRRYALAVPWYEQALAVYEQLEGDNRLAVADAKDGLAVVYTALGDYGHAAEQLEQALQLRRALLPDGHVLIADNLANLAGVKHRQGQVQDAESLYRQALDVTERVRGAEHPQVATIMNHLARTLMEQDRSKDAEPLLQKALLIRREALGPRHESVAMSLSDLGGLYDVRGDMKAAEGYYRQALELLPADHAWRGMMLSNLGRAREADGAVLEAEQLYRESLDLNRRYFGAEHDVVGVNFQRLGTLLYGMGRKTESEAALREALRIFEKQLSATHPRITEVASFLDKIAAESPRR
jgi:serine/threonine-protein kinase